LELYVQKSECERLEKQREAITENPDLNQSEKAVKLLLIQQQLEVKRGSIEALKNTLPDEE